MMQSKVESSLLQRKRIRLGRENYLGGRSCFVTICCRDRRPFFQAQGKRADLRIDPYNASVRLIELLREVAAKESFRVHAYCIMPDHVHILVEGTDVKSNLLQFVRILKLRSAFEAKRMPGGQLWQRSYYEHILRPAESTEAVAWYVWMNPVRKGLCREPTDYPHCGSFTVDWKGMYRPPVDWVSPWKCKKNKAGRSEDRPLQGGGPV